MSRKKPWGIPDEKPVFECFVLVVRGRVLTWYYKRSRKKQASLPKGCGEYANYPTAVKMILKTKRRRKGLLKRLFALKWRPCWMISLVYPYRIAYEVTPETIKSDLAYLGRKIRKWYPNSYFFYQIDYSKNSGFHIHLIGRAGNNPPKLGKLPIKEALPQWWISRIKSDEAHRIKVGFLRTVKDSHKVCSYLLRGEKFEDHLRVTSHMGNRYSFGCFNKRNAKSVKCKAYDISVDAFPEIRKIIAFDTHENSKRTSDSYLCDHDNKVMNAGSGLHIINDPALAKKIKRKLAQLKKSKKRKK